MRIRTIKPEFWKSQTMCALPAETRLLAIGLLNYADDEGYFVAHPALIRGELMPFEESHGRIPGMLQELEEAGYIQLGEDTRGQRVGRVVNFKTHQYVSKPSTSKLKPLCQFPPLSPFIPGIVAESGGNAAGGVREDSGNAPGGLPVGMERNGKGMEGNGSSAGKPPEGGDLAGSSMPEDGLDLEAGKRDACATDLEHPATDLVPEKKERGAAGAGPEGWQGAAQALWAEPRPWREWGEVPVMAQVKIRDWLRGRRNTSPERTGVSALPSDGGAKKKEGGRAPDVCFEFLVGMTGATLATVTRPMRGEINAALKAIREVCPGVTVALMRRAAAAYAERWPKATLSPSALAKHWGSLQSHAGAGGEKKEGGGAPCARWRDFAAGQLGIHLPDAPWGQVLDRVQDAIVKAWADLTPEEQEAWM